MNRSRREIKTPKRFDDEPFETSRKSQNLLLKQQSTPVEATKSAADPATSKNMIKVKLTKTKLRESFSSHDTSEIHGQEQNAPTKQQSLAIEQPKTAPEPATPKEVIKVKLTKPRHRDLPLIHIPSVVRPKREIEQVQMMTPILPTPKKRRPRTPPVFTDIIPNVVLPFWDARTAAEDHEDDNVKELVHCQCGIGEELGLMVQCETCLTWQHAHCLGIEKPEDAPDGYTCQACSDPRFARESMRWSFDQDWLLKGRMKKFNCDKNPLNEQDVDTLYKINRLIDATLKVYQLTHSLRIKTRLLSSPNDDDPELKLFRVQWSTEYQHSDGTPFIPNTGQISDTPASTISAMDATPDPGDIPVETVAEAALPEIGQLVDVSAILDDTDLPSGSMQPLEATPNDCRKNLKLHIQQTEEYINRELSIRERQLTQVERQISSRDSNSNISFESLKNDLKAMNDYIRANQNRGTERSTRD